MWFLNFYKMSCFSLKIVQTQCRSYSSLFNSSSKIWPNPQIQFSGCLNPTSFDATCPTSKRQTVTSQTTFLFSIHVRSVRINACTRHFSTAQTRLKKDDVKKDVSLLGLFQIEASYLRYNQDIVIIFHAWWLTFKLDDLTSL